MIVDFFGIGAPKAATTWLALCLREHPEIELPSVKETTYFSSEKKFSRGVSFFHGHFSERDKGTNVVYGEFSVPYLAASIKTAARIHQYNEYAKLIVILRDPYERAYSHYQWLVQLGKISASVSFEDATITNPDILQSSLYGKHLSDFLQYFSVNSFLLIEYSQISKDAAGVYSTVCDFLNVAPDYKPKALHKVIGKTISVRYRGLESLRQMIYRFVRLNNLHWAIPFVKRIGLSSLYRYLNSSSSLKRVQEPGYSKEMISIINDDIRLLSELFPDFSSSIVGWLK